MTNESAVALSVAGAFLEGDHRIYPASLLFKAGEYPDKQFAMSEEELKRAADAFARVKINLEHAPKMLVGRLGEVRKAWTDAAGKTLFGEVAIPTWLDDRLTDDERKVSCEWDRETKTLLGLALTQTPRVQGAALMAAFTLNEAFRLDEASRLDQASRAAVNPPATEPAQPDKETNRMPTLKDCLAFFGIKPDDAQAVPDASVALSTAAPGATAPPATDDAEIKRLREQLAAERTGRIATEAATFADSQVTACKALPAERDAIVKLYTVAATQAADHGVVKFADGSESSMVDAIKAAFAARTPHQLTQPADRLADPNAKILADDRGANMSRGDIGPDGKPVKAAPMTSERKKELRKLSGVPE